ncbi:hypothetical protein QWY31_04850 [Cytophagales bacterium LB-30]|uniref:WG repeat-containing protein n=1 Tax=Shiella aurantiaca TaxID=3058365 RepID=A0ABT8F2X9_9BACT|nr:hypothetical protein [Shiella aurantiaca]MDN4164817.1 hypothetical protein [Shiella aurantiaca]
MKSSLILLIYFCCQLVPAQEKISLSIKGLAEGLYSVDNQNNLLCADQSGNVYKYNPQGERISVYSPPMKSPIASLQANLTFRIVVFYEKLQQVIVLDRLLRPIQEWSLSEEIGFGQALCMDANNRYWIIDSADNSLKLLNANTHETEQTIRFDLLFPEKNYQFSRIVFHQNQLYLLDFNQGILRFDLLGQPEGFILEEAFSEPRWLGDWLEIQRNDSLMYLHLYSGKRVNTLKETGLQEKNRLVQEGEVLHWYQK